MRQAHENIWWHYNQPNRVICITTNGSVKLNGECVMGRGNALQAREKIPTIGKELGMAIRANGNVVQLLDGGRVVAFPVKKMWMLKADIALIANSAQQLKAMADMQPGVTFYLPRPGIGNGKLSWDDVRPVLEELPENVVVCIW